ncbi:conjugal transfer protein [Pseudolactococcus yaeyamensis]
MRKDYIFDYSKGLNSPLWLQEFRNPKTHQLIFSFQTPMELSFFVVAFLVAAIELWFGRVWFILSDFTFGLIWLFVVWLPIRAGRLYTTWEPDGKKMHIYLVDKLRFFREFILDKRLIYQTERIEEIEEIVFEKTDL